MISVYQRETDGEHLTVAVRVHAVKNFPRRFFQHGQVLPVSEVCGQVVPLNNLFIAHQGVVMTPPRHRQKMRLRARSLSLSLSSLSFFSSLSVSDQATSIHAAREPGRTEGQQSAARGFDSSSTWQGSQIKTAGQQAQAGLVVQPLSVTRINDGTKLAVYEILDKLPLISSLKKRLRCPCPEHGRVSCSNPLSRHVLFPTERSNYTEIRKTDDRQRCLQFCRTAWRPGCHCGSVEDRKSVEI